MVDANVSVDQPIASHHLSPLFLSRLSAGYLTITSMLTRARRVSWQNPCKYRKSDRLFGSADDAYRFFFYMAEQNWLEEGMILFVKRLRSGIQICFVGIGYGLRKYWQIGFVIK